MKGKNILAIVAISGFVFTGCASFQNKGTPYQTYQNPVTGQTEKKVSMEYISKITPGWPESSQMAAKEMVQKHGAPTEVDNNSLRWRNIAPFKKIIVHREETPHNFPLLHQDVLEHVIEYRAPEERLSAVTKYNGSIVFNRTKGELSAFGDKEATNILSLNLAHEIFEGIRSIESARMHHGKQLMEELNGRPSGYTQGLMFMAQNNTADPGVSVTNQIQWVQLRGKKSSKSSTSPQAQQAR